MAAKTAAEIVKIIFGDKETLTQAEVLAACESSGLKLADLSGGDFVTTAKYNDRITKLEAERDESNKKVATYEAEKTKADRTNALAGLGVSEDFRDFVLDQVTKTLTDENADFDAAAKKYVDDHKQYVKEAAPETPPTTEPKLPSSFPLGKGGTAKSEGEGDFDSLTHYLKTGEF